MQEVAEESVFSEDILEARDEEQPAWKTRELTRALESEMNGLFQFCTDVLDNVTDPVSLTEETLKAVRIFALCTMSDGAILTALLDALTKKVNDEATCISLKLTLLLADIFSKSHHPQSFLGMLLLIFD